MRRTNLITKMEKALGFNVVYKASFNFDLAWLSVDGFGCNDYLWIVKEESTELIPLLLTVAKGSLENKKAHVLEGNGVKAYLIKVTSRDNETVDGAMTEIKNLKRFLSDNEKTPTSVTMVCELNEKRDEVTIDWHPDYYEIIVGRIRVSPKPEDKWCAYVKEIHY